MGVLRLLFMAAFVFLGNSSWACTDYSGNWEGACEAWKVESGGTPVPTTVTRSASIRQIACDYIDYGSYVIPLNKTSASIEPFPKFHFFYTVAADWTENSTVYNWVTSEHLRAIDNSDVMGMYGQGNYHLVGDQLIGSGKTHTVELKNGKYTEFDEWGRCVFKRKAGPVQSPSWEFNPGVHLGTVQKACVRLHGQKCKLR